MWLTFAPVPSYTASFYNISVSDVDWFSMAYFVVSLVTGFVSIFVLDTLGLKVAVSVCVWLDLVYGVGRKGRERERERERGRERGVEGEWLTT